jgi:DNA repair exonuclease SbcCD ATPase subunit
MKQELLEKCTNLGIKVNKSMSIKALKLKLSEYELKDTVEISANGTVEYVYHLADIHIRYIDRHEEYRLVFNKLVEHVKCDPNLQKSIMVICGDIFHNKDRFVSETIILFDEFIKELSSLLPVFIILGNHDCFNHRDRLDTLTGIMKVKDYKNVNLLKNSGFYNYANVTFGVSSIIDGEITKCTEKYPERTYIGLYHGIVSGCHLDNDYKTNGLSIDNFANYDIVMLGDVHKRQFLDGKRIAYPGSLIQQNFKEDLKHGCLLWDLKTLKSKFIEISNDYSFINLDISQDINSVDFTPYSRVRILIDIEDLESDVKHFTDLVSKKTKILSIKSIFKEKIFANNEQEDQIESKSLDNRERDIIRSFLSENESIEDILQIHDLLESTIEQSDMNYKNTLPWKIKEIEFMNIFCYGNDTLNKIKLNSGITGILAANASGKTNILNTILYGLFGNIYTRNQNQNNRNIVSRYSNKKELYVKLTIEIDGETYYITRRAKNRKRNTTNGENVLLSETVDFCTDAKSLNLANKSETERCIRETLSFSTKEDFILTNMISNISYGTGISIISMNGTQLDEIFNSMFNLNKYKLLHNESKNICKKLSQEKGVLDGKISLLKGKMDIDIEDNKSQLKKLKQDIEHNENKLEILTSEIEQVYEDISKINKKNLDVKESKDFLLEKIKEDTRLLGDFDENLLDKESFYENECERISKLIKNSEFLKAKKIENLRERDIQDIETDIAFYEGKKQKISFSADITEEYINAKKIIQNYKKQDKLDLVLVKNTILGMKYDEKGDYYILYPQARKTILEDLDKTYISIDDFSKYQKIIEDKERRDEIVNENIQIQQKLTGLKLELKQNNINHAHKLKENVVRYTEYLEKIDLYYELQDTKHKLKLLEDNNEYGELIKKRNTLSSEITEIKSRLKELNHSASFIEYIIKTYTENYNTKASLDTECKDIQKKIQLYKKYTEITHSKNLPKQLISNVVKNICIEANKLIYNSCGLLCEIQENEKWEIVIKKGDIYIGPEHCSGYERFVVNVSLKIAFDKFKQLPTIKLFLIDEVIDCVSEDNFEQIDVILDSLRKQYSNVFLISHNEELKKKVQYRIDISIENNCSYIVT